jgi:6-phosphofructokinase
MGRYFGIGAVNLAVRKQYGKMVSYRNGQFTAVPIVDVIGRLNLVDTNTMYDVQRYNGSRSILADQEKKIE